MLQKREFYYLLIGMTKTSMAARATKRHPRNFFPGCKVRILVSPECFSVFLFSFLFLPLFLVFFFFFFSTLNEAGLPLPFVLRLRDGTP